MADVSKLKNRRSNSLGNPPGPDEVATSLSSPEIAPAHQTPEFQPVVYSSAIENKPVDAYVRRDGRSARKTNRTLAFATRVTPEFDNEVRDIAEREGLKLVEVLEKAIDSYKEKMGY